MKQRISLLLLFFCLTFSFHSLAQSGDQAVRACLADYMSGDADRMQKAFHSSATMKFVDLQTKELKDIPIADYIARVRNNTNKMDRKIEIVSLNIEGSAAQAKIKIETAEALVFDYMNLLKIRDEWKIVSKVFSRQLK